MSVKCPACDFDNPDNTNFCGNCSTPLKGRKTRIVGATQTLVETHQTSLKTGSVLAGRYEIIELLGRGGMGKVYKAHDLDIDEDVALKVIRRDIADNPQIIQRFQNELKLARQISHRNVCRMFDMGKDGSTQFITMEYVPGEDLKTTIHRMGAMTVRKALEIGKQICQGLSEAHGHGVIHRDLKPSNIIVDRQGSVRIMDFGIAVSPKTEGLTDPEAAPGTIDYLAPEQLKGKKAGPATDIYSLGVILYEILTGQLPYRGDSSYVVAVKHLTGTPKDPSGLNPLVPPALSRVILKCLAKDPDKRYREAGEVCAELERVEEALPDLNGGTVFRRLWVWLRARPALKWGAAAFLLAAAAWAAWAIFGGGTGGREGLPLPESRASLIVLPFKNVNMAQDYVWAQVLNQIINGLEKSGLRLVPYETALQYKTAPLPDAEIARKHGVNNILKGSMALREGKIVFEVELRRIQPDETLFIQQFTSASDQDFNEALGAISRMTADRLGVTLTPRRADATPKDTEAKRFYSYGQRCEAQYLKSGKPEDFEAAVSNYRKSLEFEPGAAVVYWRLGMLYEGRFNVEKRDGDEKQMMQYLRRAYDLDAKLAESNLAMGWVYFNLEDHDKAYRFFKRAMELDGDGAEANYHVGSFLRSLGLYKQARVHYSRALGLTPAPDDFAVNHQLLADCDSQLGNVPAGAQLLRTAMSVRDYHLTLDLSVCLIKMKEYGEAGQQIEAARGQGAGDTEVRRVLALYYAATGRRPDALELIKDEKKLSNHLVVSVNALLGFRDKAVRAIEATRSREGFRDFRWYPYTYLVLMNNPFFENLKGEPFFQKILAEEKAVYDERVRKYGDL